MNTIDTAALNQLDGITLIDVREEHEYITGHAPMAKNVPLSRFVDRVDEVPRDQTVYIICESGGRSAQAVQWLDGQGFDAVNVEGGTAAWRSAGLPIETGN